jgi:hypothetical protein
MQLTPQQIDRLYQFTRQHYVEWYDLQTELVDHLANAIEQQWQENPIISFEDALQKEFKKFGVFGFMDVVEKRQAAMNKRYNKILWQHFKEFFTIPKIVLTFIFVIATFYTFKLIFFNEIFAVGLLLLLLFTIPFLIIEQRKIKKRKKETGKVWLLEQIIFGHGSILGMVTIPFNLFNSLTHFEKAPNDFVIFGLSLLLVSLFLGSYIITKVIPSKAEDYLNEAYPEYALENTK